MSNALVALVGPTAAGKSALALELAQRYDMEIVNADAFCVYRGMDIGTAKPSVAERAQVRHHLIDTHDVQDTVDVATYQAQARSVIEDVWSRGRIPLLTGGSGLYVHAVLDDLNFPGTDAAVRRRLEAELEAVGAQQLHARLAQVDPQAAEQILPGNGRRIVRALEVNEITGEPFIATFAASRAWTPAVRIAWDPGVETVDANIAGRVDQMWMDGFVDEVRGLMDQMGRTAASAVGYRQVIEAVRRGEDPDTAKEETALATRRLARRQRKWFRRDSNIRWAESVAQVHEMFATLET